MVKDDGLIKPTAQSLTYDRYLKVKELLSLQQTISQPAEHDETLFIVIHQVYELWFKQLLHEMNACCQALTKQQLMRFLHGLKRIDTIQKILIHQVDILETMTPDDFARFRAGLNPASGFQSSQFREVEYRLGLKDPAYLRFHENAPETHKHLQEVLKQPTLQDYFLQFLAKRGYAIPQELLHKKDPTAPHTLNAGLVQVYVEIYRKPYEHSEVYLALEALMDLDEQFMLWRYRHVAMVQRMIGSRPGTGGSRGAGYLQTTLEKRLFPEIWEVRNHLGTDYST